MRLIKRKDASRYMSASRVPTVQESNGRYALAMGGLDGVDPNSAEGSRYTALFEPLFKQCR